MITINVDNNLEIRMAESDVEHLLHNNNSTNIFNMKPHIIETKYT